jgi:hypothetical protein
MDADDVALPDRFRLQADRAMAADSPDVVACRVELLNPLGDGMQAYVNWTNELLDPEAIGHRRFVESPVIHPSAMIRAAALEEIGGYRDVGWAEDHDLWLRLLARGRRVVKLPQVLLRWRDSDRRLTRVDPRYGREARTAMRGHFLARLPAVADRGVCLAGAGPIGKSLARCLLAEGVAVAGFFEVHRGRIGQRIHGLPVADSAQLAERWRDRVLLGAVGLPGRREWIRRLALESGRVEGEDFWSVC